MRYFLRPALAGVLAAVGAGCDQSAPSSAPATSLSVTVAPLDLPNMTDACYGLTVFDTTDPLAFGDATQVWTQPELCASQYGADGGIRFTGICDAQAAGATHDNAIRLVLNNVYANGDHTSGTALESGSDFVNPCPAPTEGQPDNGCVLTAPCTENQDSKIVFNLTVMRNASLGFFDTVVKFQDLFCAAKLDCVEDDGQTALTYLPIPGASPAQDGPTAVLGFACTGGSDAAATYMYLDDLVVTCSDGRTATVDPSAGPGIVAVTQTGGDPVLFSAAVNRGDSLNGSQYWNVLLGMSLSGATDAVCTLTTKGTASDVALAAGATPDHSRYPVIEWSVPLSTGADRTCTRHPLNGGNGVATTYTTIATPATFAYQLLRVAGEQGTVTPTNQVSFVAERLTFSHTDAWALTGIENRLYAAAYSSPDVGSELFTSDGTAAGSGMVGDFNSGPNGADPSQFMAFAGQVYFRQDDGVHGYELWKTDGTAAGTTMVADLQPGPWGSHPQQLVVLGDHLFFLAWDQAHGYEIRSLDASGNLAVIDAVPGPNAPSVNELTAFGGALYFSGFDEAHGAELWTSDGTTAGTGLFKDLAPGAAFGGPRTYRVVGTTMYFVADDGVNGTELWKTDGTVDGTVLAADLNPTAINNGSSWPFGLTAVGDKLFFFGFDEQSTGSLWVTEGGVTTRIATLPGGDAMAFAGPGRLYFFAYNSPDWELWTSDGTSAGTFLLNDPAHGLGGFSNSIELVTLGDKAYYEYTTPTTGSELWETDGTVAGTHIAHEFGAGELGGNPLSFARMGDSIYFNTAYNDGGNWMRNLFRFGPPR